MTSAPGPGTSANPSPYPSRLPLTEAVKEYVRPGSRVYIGNFGAQLFAVGHEIIRQGIGDLDLVVASGGLLMDQLLGAGALRSATFAHCWSPVGPGPAWNFRRTSENTPSAVTWHELSIGHLTAALTAGAWGVPFMPVPDLTGTGYVDEDWSNGLLDLASSARLGSCLAVKALVPDVAFIHVDCVDAQGNASLPVPAGEALVAAQAARHVVLIAEELTSTAAVQQRGIRIPGVLGDTVVVLPGAVAPDGAAGRYERDVRGYEEYVRAASTAEGFSSWLGDLREGGRQLT